MANPLRFAVVGALSGLLSAILVLVVSSLELNTGPLHTLGTVAVRFLPGVVFGFAIALASRRGSSQALGFATVCGVIYVFVVLGTAQWYFPGRGFVWGGIGALAVGWASNAQLGTSLGVRQLAVVGIAGAIAGWLFLFVFDIVVAERITVAIAFAIWQSAVAAALGWATARSR